MKTLLKKTALILSGISFISFAHATVHTVHVMNISFSPSSFSASVGDTVEWIWVNGNHTTTSLGIPTNAASWSNPMTSSSTTFEYKITTAGTYNYWCAIHQTMMEASFTVSPPTGTPTVVDKNNQFAKVYPNPTSNSINIHFLVSPSQNQLTITDELGKELINKTLTSIDNTVDVSTWPKGVYFYRLQNGNEFMEGKFEVQ